MLKSWRLLTQIQVGNQTRRKFNGGFALNWVFKWKRGYVYRGN